MGVARQIRFLVVDAYTQKGKVNERLWTNGSGGR